jgi:hypothetical protein
MLLVSKPVITRIAPPHLGRMDSPDARDGREHRCHQATKIVMEQDDRTIERVWSL